MFAISEVLGLNGLKLPVDASVCLHFPPDAKSGHKARIGTSSTFNLTLVGRYCLYLHWSWHVTWPFKNAVPSILPQTIGDLFIKQIKDLFESYFACFDSHD